MVVDEVQRLPSLLNEVHRLIETRRLRFVLLGSSARKLKAAGVNLLAGRALRKTMFPLTAAELGPAFDLDRVLRHGSIPLVWTSDAPRDVLEAYAQLYLREEIRAEALVRNLPGFVRFLPVAALFNGQVINVAGIARETGVARTTVHGYLDILEDTLLVFRLPAYESRPRVRERRLPKLYWVDPGRAESFPNNPGSAFAYPVRCFCRSRIQFSHGDRPPSFVYGLREKQKCRKSQNSKHGHDRANFRPLSSASLEASSNAGCSS